MKRTFYLLETNCPGTDNESKRNYVDPRIKPCVVLIERCKIPQIVGSTCNQQRKHTNVIFITNVSQRKAIL